MATPLPMPALLRRYHRGARKRPFGLRVPLYTVLGSRLALEGRIGGDGFGVRPQIIAEGRCCVVQNLGVVLGITGEALATGMQEVRADIAALA